MQYRTYCRWLKDAAKGRPVGKAGRPRKFGPEVREAIVRFARENVGWGYLRIVGELLKLHTPIGATTVRRILKDVNIHPEPIKPGRKRGDGEDSSWNVFLKLHLNTLVACDFFCKKVWTVTGKHDAYCLFFVHLQSRKVWVSPSTFHPNETWVNQQARNVLMWLEDNAVTVTHLVRDRDTKFAGSFDRLFQTARIEVVKTPARSPNCNAYAEPWVGSVKRECLNAFACFSLGHLDHIVWTYAKFYNTHRPHQGKENQTLRFQHEPLKFTGETEQPLGKLRCRKQLGGLLRYYERAA